MGKIIVDLELNQAEMEFLKERVRRANEEGLDETSDCAYGIADEIRSIVENNNEMFAVFDPVRNSAEVQESLNQAVHKEIEKMMTANGEAEKTMTADEEVEKTMSANGEAEKAMTATDEAEKVTTADDEAEKVTAATEEAEKVIPADEEVAKVTTADEAEK